MSDAHGVARDQLRAFIERIERLEEEKKTIADDIKDVYGEAKAMGFIPAMIKKVVALRKKDEQQRMEEEAILDTYLAALGMLAQHDLFEETPAATNTAVGSGAGSAAPLRIQPETASETVGGFPVAAAPTSAEETGATQQRDKEADEVPHHLEPTRGDGDGIADSDRRSHGQAAGRSPESQTDGTETVTAGETASNSNPVANTEEGATGAIAAASNDPASRADEDSERQHSSTVGFADDCRTGGKEQSDASAAPVGDAAADAHGIPELHSPSDDDAIAAVNGKAGLANVIDVEPSSSAQTDPNEDRSEGHSLDGETVGANTGGRDVDSSVERAPGQQQGRTSNMAGGLVSIPPAKPLRPNCLRPKNCGGYGSNHCFSCKKAAKANEEEVAA